MKKNNQPKESVISISAGDITKRHDDVFIEHLPGKIIGHQVAEKKYFFQSNSKVALMIELAGEGIFKIRYANDGIFTPNFSYAIDPNYETTIPASTLVEKKSYFIIQSDAGSCRISKKDMSLSFYDEEDKLLNKDATPYYAKSTLKKGITIQRITKSVTKGEFFYGLGDKTGAPNLRGQKYENWTTDSFAYGAGTDPIYRSIPFYYGLKNGQAYGLFLDNSNRSFFDFDSKKKGELTIETDGGVMQYYFFFGPSLLDVSEKYMTLTGAAPLPPMWSLGFHQCRWSYFPEQRARTVAAEFRKRKIPCDAIYLDIDYMDKYKCFTWNERAFPKFERLPKDLAKAGFKLIVMIDPGLKADTDYPIFEEALRNDYLCKRSDGTLYKGPVWPGLCGFPDFTHPEVRNWWGQQYHHFYKTLGIGGFWNDMNEPAVFYINNKTMPNDVLHDHDGFPTNHKNAHNIYGMQMARASYEGLLDLDKNRRPFLLGRATFSGGQRYSAIWTGDNVANWAHLKLANRQVQRLNISGFVFSGSDIGGFVDVPSGELFVRWLQLGAFHPFYRVHSMGNNIEGDAAADLEKVLKMDALERKDQEPWSYGEPYTQLAKEAIELRYRLLPYLYTAFWKHQHTGSPIVLPMSFYDQTDPNCLKNNDQFIYGNDLLIAPVLRKGQKTMSVYLPKGTWFDFYTGKKYEGKQSVRIKTSLDTIPIFAKAGSVIPEYPVMQFTGEFPIEILTVKVFVGNGVSLLYEDTGDGYGDGLLQQFYLSENGNKFLITRKQKGKFKPAYKLIKMQIFGLSKNVKIKVGAKKWAFEDTNQYIELMVPSSFKKINITNQ